MKLFDFGSTAIAIIVITAIIGVVSYEVLHLEEDNPIEESAEEVIKQTTGIDVDLSPDSPEDEKEEKDCK